MPPEQELNGQDQGDPMATLAGLFGRDVAGATPTEPEPTRAPPQQQTEIDAGADDGDGQEIDGDTLELEVEAETPNDRRTIEPPAGMSAADRAFWETLPPEAQSFLVAQESRRTADYTRKTSEVATERKKAADARATYEARANEQMQLLGHLANAELVPPDPAKAEEDPFQYAKELGQYNQALHEQKRAQREFDRLAHEHDTRQREARKAFVEEQTELLRKEVPALFDPEKGPALANRVTKFALDMGVPAERMKMVTALEMKLLHKAMLYDAAVSKAKAQAKGQAPATRTAAPGRLPGTPQASQAKQARIKSLNADLQKNPGDLKTVAKIWGEFL